MGHRYIPVPVKLFDYMDAVNRYMAGEINELKKNWIIDGIPKEYQRKNYPNGDDHAKTKNRKIKTIVK